MTPYPPEEFDDVIAVDRLSRRFGPKQALDGVSVRVPRGSVFGLVGANGAGKTTLIRTLLGLITIDAGSGEVLGLDIRARRLDIRQRVGFMPANSRKSWIRCAWSK